MLFPIAPIAQRIFEVSRSKWWQLIAGPLIAGVFGFFVVKDIRKHEDLMLVVGMAAVGFVAVLMLIIRDAVTTLKRTSGIARLTPGGFVGVSSGAAEINDRAVLAEIVRTVGQPPRRGTSIAGMYRTPPRPPWLTRDDLVSRIFDHYREIVDRGEVRWAAVIHANSTLFAPGTIDGGAQVIYALEDVPLARLRKWAHACYAVKETTPADPAVRKIADMLTDELERALDWAVPPSLCEGGKAITTVVELQRELLPLGYLTAPFFPVFADPVTKMAVVVPSGWWPAELVNCWVGRGRPGGDFEKD